ncbi:MAG: hypothetical protein J6Q69_04885 [Clostridia bacterium]|nr:hypothetical protein [Clostridia bacterium]
MKKYVRIASVLISLLLISVLCTFASFANETEEVNATDVEAQSSNAVQLDNGYVYNPPLPTSGVEGAFAEYVFHTHENEADKADCLFCKLHVVMTQQQFGTEECPYCAANTMHPLTDRANFFIEYMYFSERDTACYMLGNIMANSDSTITILYELTLENGEKYPPPRGFDSPLILEMNGYAMTFNHYSGNSYAECLVSIEDDVHCIMRNGLVMSSTNISTGDYNETYVGKNASAPIFGLNSPGAKFTFENITSASAGLITSLVADEEKCPEIYIKGGQHYVIFPALNDECSDSALVQSVNNVKVEVTDSTILIDEDGSLVSSKSYGKYDMDYESKSTYLFKNSTIVGAYANVNLVPYTNNRTTITFIESHIQGSILPELDPMDAEYVDPYTGNADLALPVEGDRLIEIGRMTYYASKGTGVSYYDYYETFTLEFFTEDEYRQYDIDPETKMYYMPRREFTYIEDTPTEFRGVTLYGDIYDVHAVFERTQALIDPSKLAGGQNSNLYYYDLAVTLTVYPPNVEKISDSATLFVPHAADVTFSAIFDKMIVNVQIVSNTANLTENKTDYILPGEPIPSPEIDTETVHQNGYIKYQYTGRWLDEAGNVVDFTNYIADYDENHWWMSEYSTITVYPEAIVTPYLSCASYSLTLTTDILLNIVIPKSDEVDVRIISVTAGGESIVGSNFTDFDNKLKTSYAIARPGTSDLTHLYEATVLMDITMPGLNGGAPIRVEQKIKNLSAFKYIVTVLADSLSVETGENIYSPKVHTMMADLLRYSDSVIAISGKNDAYTETQRQVYEMFAHLCTPIPEDMEARLRAYGTDASLEGLEGFVEYITFSASNTSLTPIIKLNYAAKVTSVDFTLEEGWVHGAFSVNNSNWGESSYQAKSSTIYWSRDGSFLARRIGNEWYEVDEYGVQKSVTPVDASLVSRYIAVISPEGLQIYNIEKLMRITLTTEGGESASGTYGLAAYYAAKMNEYNLGRISAEAVERINALVLNTCAFGSSAAGYRFGEAIDKNGNSVTSLW